MLGLVSFLASVRRNLLGVYLKTHTHTTKVVSIAQAEFWGTQCAGLFFSMSPKLGEKVCVHLS